MPQLVQHPSPAIMPGIEYQDVLHGIEQGEEGFQGESLSACSHVEALQREDLCKKGNLPPRHCTAELAIAIGVIT